MSFKCVKLLNTVNTSIYFKLIFWIINLILILADFKYESDKFFNIYTAIRTVNLQILIIYILILIIFKNTDQIIFYIYMRK